MAPLVKGDPDEPLDAFKKKLVALADEYASRSRNVVSYWTMGFNQHTRGTWVNEQAYMVHLLTGKQARPGAGAFSLTGQPSACGTAREVGTFAHRLPADMQVDVAEHRATAEEIWRLPRGTLNPKVGADVTKQMRDLEDGKIRWLWMQVTNLFQSTANANHWIKAAREKDCFIVVSDVYPTISGQGGRPHPPLRHHLREVGRLRELGAAHAALAPAGGAARGGPQRRLADDGVLQALQALRGVGRAEGARPGGGGLHRW